MFYIIIYFVLLLIFIIYKFLTWDNDFWIKQNVPAQKFSLKNFVTIQNIAITIDNIYREFKGHNVAGMFQMKKPQLLIIDPEFIKKVYINNFNNFHDNFEFFEVKTSPTLKSNPFVLKGEQWKYKRNEISPAFTTSRIKSMYFLMEDVCKNMTNFIKQESQKNKNHGLDTKELCAKFATDVVSSCIFAVDAASFTQENPIIREMGKYFFRPDAKVFLYFLFSDSIPIMKKFVKIRIFPKFAEEFFLNTMYDAIKYRHEKKIDRHDYLQYLINLKEKKEITEEDMASHGVTFFVNGFDTSSTLIAATLYQLACNEEVQSKLRKEILDHIDEHGKITFDILVKLQYLDQTINESLRIFPPLPLSIKTCTEDIELELGKDHKVLVKKGMLINIPIYSIHRDPEFYPEPLKFIPERFNEELGGIKAFQDKGVFIPFGLGPRICVGKKFAIVQAKTAIVEIIQNFKVSVNPKMIEPITWETFSVILAPKGGYYLDFHEIK